VATDGEEEHRPTVAPYEWERATGRLRRNQAEQTSAEISPDNPLKLPFFVVVTAIGVVVAAVGAGLGPWWLIAAGGVWESFAP
jgi:hypothetical protein